MAAAASFSLLLAGTNAISPLLPVYRRVLDFPPLMLSATFVAYVATMVLVLLICTRAAIVRRAPHVLLTGLVLAAAGDLLLASGTPAGVLTGRVVAGVSNGIATGAAAALVVVAVGAAGRSLAATGNLVGAVIGTAYSVALVLLLGTAAVHWVFLIHAAASLAAAFALARVLRSNRTENRLALAAREPQGGRPRLAVAPLATGCVSWSAVALAIVFLPSAFDALGAGAAGQAAVLVVLILSAGAQLGSDRLAVRLPRFTGMGTMAGGAAAIAVGIVVDAPVLALVGAGALGAGLGVAYRLGLVVLMLGAPPARGGATSSAYAAITYTASASAVLAAGALGNVIGLVPAVAASFTTLALAAVALAHGAPRFDATRPG